MKPCWIIGAGVLVFMVVLILILSQPNSECYEASQDFYFNNFKVAGGSMQVDGKNVKIDKLKLVSKSNNKIIVRGSHPEFKFSGAEKKIPLNSAQMSNLVMVMKGNGDFEILQDKGNLERVQVDNLVISAEFSL